MVSTRIGAVIGFTLVMCLSACNSGASNPSESRTPPSGRSFQPFLIPPERLQAVIDASSAFERALVSDGALSFEEYERAVFANVACMESKGLSISHSDSTVRYDLGDLKPGPRLSKRGIYHFVAGAPDSFGPDALREATAECTAQFNTVVSLLWAEHSRPTIQESQQYRDAIARCIREAGQDAPDHPSDQDLLRVAYPPDGLARPDQLAPDWYTKCEADAIDAFEIG